MPKILALRFSDPGGTADTDFPRRAGMPCTWEPVFSGCASGFLGNPRAAWDRGVNPGSEMVNRSLAPESTGPEESLTAKTAWASMARRSEEAAKRDWVIAVAWYFGSQRTREVPGNPRVATVIKRSLCWLFTAFAHVFIWSRRSLPCDLKISITENGYKGTGKYSPRVGDHDHSVGSWGPSGSAPTAGTVLKADLAAVFVAASAVQRR